LDDGAFPQFGGGGHMCSLSALFFPEFTKSISAGITKTPHAPGSGERYFCLPALGCGIDKPSVVA